jgi:hypothetical protein
MLNNFCPQCGKPQIPSNLELKKQRSARWMGVGPKRPTLFLACATCGYDVGWYSPEEPTPPKDYTLIKVVDEQLTVEQIRVSDIELINKENVIAIIDGWPKVNLVE